MIMGIQDTHRNYRRQMKYNNHVYRKLNNKRRSYNEITGNYEGHTTKFNEGHTQKLP